jgi:hypothetical protein
VFAAIKNWLNVGVQVSARTSDADMVTAGARKNVPVTRAMEISGKNPRSLRTSAVTAQIVTAVQ